LGPSRCVIFRQGGSFDGLVIDPEVICSYAGLRGYLRTAMEELHEVEPAIRELFEADFAAQPKTAAPFSAMAAPIRTLVWQGRRS
jgi:hypothetical protein